MGVGGLAAPLRVRTPPLSPPSHLPSPTQHQHSPLAPLLPFHPLPPSPLPPSPTTLLPPSHASQPSSTSVLRRYASEAVVAVRTAEVLCAGRGPAEQLLHALRGGQPATLPMLSTTSGGRALSHTLRVEPLRDSLGLVQCYQATSSNVQMHDGGASGAAGAAAAAAAGVPTQPPPAAEEPRTPGPLGAAGGAAAAPLPSPKGPSPDGAVSLEIGEMLEWLDGGRSGLSRNSSANNLAAMGGAAASPAQKPQTLLSVPEAPEVPAAAAPDAAPPSSSSTSTSTSTATTTTSNALHAGAGEQ